MLEMRPIRLGAVIPAMLLAAIAATTGARAEARTKTAAELLQDRIASLSDTVVRPDEQSALTSFYAARGYQPIWFSATGPSAAALNLIGELADADNQGLRASDFLLTHAMRPLAVWQSANAQERAAAEYELAGPILKYARHARGGRIENPERQLSDFLDRRPQMPNPAEVLARIAAAADPAGELRAYHPSHPQFQKLRHLLAATRRDSELHRSHAINSKGPLLAPGMTSDEIATLRKRLAVTESAGDPRTFDAALKKAVRAFQQVHGLGADGLVGSATRRALNTGAEKPVDAIIASMEQWRWMPQDLGARHVLVNIPSYTANFVQDGEVKLTERVITGKAETPTPVFSKNMSTIVVRPSWVLPDSIKREKLLSAARRGTTIENQGLVVMKGEKKVDSGDVDWAKVDLTHYRIVQPSGHGNALGAVKFLFPNKFSVYLHDTPKKSLFENQERPFSHGCVRLRNPLEAAQFILDGDKGPAVMNAQELADDGPENNEITLDKPLPVHIGYFSVWINEDGEAEFHGDPYGHDNRVGLALAGKWNEIDRGPAHETEPDGEWFVAARTLNASKRSGVAQQGDYAPASKVADVPAKPMKVFASPQGLFNADLSPGKPDSKAKPKQVTQASGGGTKRRGSVTEIMNSVFAR